jgi:hypothetical protein
MRRAAAFSPFRTATNADACERASPQAKSLFGFACAAKDSGPVPTGACAGGCEMGAP